MLCQIDIGKATMSYQTHQMIVTKALAFTPTTLCHRRLLVSLHNVLEISLQTFSLRYVLPESPVSGLTIWKLPIEH
jgi:hypothetical protein